ncbi:MAG: hypothetical protein AAF657_06610 [Acidobacteriota bacterium]
MNFFPASTTYRFVTAALIVCTLAAAPAFAKIQESQPLKVEISRCDLGQRCQLIEATSKRGSLSLVSSYSTSQVKSGRPGPSVLQYEVRVATRDLSTTLHFLILSDFGGSSQSVSYMIDGKPATRDESLALYEQIGTLFPGLNLPQVALTRATFLSCFKEVVVMCGGSHNDGNCDNFQWYHGGNIGTQGCAGAGVLGCAAAHPWTAVGCSLAQAF